MSFRIQGIDPSQFADLHTLSDEALKARHIERVTVTEKPSAPCRISLDDAEIGEDVLLINYDHLPVETAYRQQGPIFVRAIEQRFDDVDVIPPAMARRTLSLRAFDADHMMIEADLVEGRDAAELIARFFANPAVTYMQAHYARRGCFAARIDRA